MQSLIEQVLEYRESPSLERRQELAEAILGAVYPALRQFILCQCPKEAVEDVLQETLMGLARNLHQFRGDTRQSFWTWCYQTARYKVANHARSRAARLVPTDPEDLEAAVEASGEDRPFEPGEWVDLKETMSMLRRIQPPCHHYLVAVYFHGAEIAELARAEGVSYDAMRMRFNRCLDLARDLTAQ